MDSQTKTRAEELREQVTRAARDLIAQMSLDEKVSYIDAQHPAIERLGLPDYRLEAEGAHGVVIRAGQSGIAEDGVSTVFPEPLGLSQTWDKALLKQVGAAIGDEARIYGKYNLFYPTIDMERDPRWGRNEEAYGEDPFLAGKLAAELIKGTQGEAYPYLKTAATVKHFYANNYEFERDWADSVMPEQLKHDYYLRVFSYAIREAGAASLMTSYNKTNGVVNMLNPELDSLLRRRWKADGYFVSDGAAFELLPQMHPLYQTYAEYAAAALKAGLDCILAYDSNVLNQALHEALDKGLLAESDLDTALLHQFEVLIRLGLYPGLEGNPYQDTPKERLCSPAHSALARQAALESVVLLKNDGLLPLPPGGVDRIAVIGQLAAENMMDWYSGLPPYTVTPLAGIRAEFPDAQIDFVDGCDRVAFLNEATGGWTRVLPDGSLAFDGTAETRSLFRSLDWGYGFAFQDCASGKYLTTTEDGQLRADADKVWGWFNREVFFIDRPNVYSAQAANPPQTDPAHIDGGHFVPEVPFGVDAQPAGASRAGKNMYLKIYSPEGVMAVNQTLAALRVSVVEDGLAAAGRIAAAADVAVLTLGNHCLIGARECVDRPSLALPERFAALSRTVTEANRNTVLVLIAGYPYELEEEEAMARAVLFSTHGLQEVGTAIGQTLSGTNNPAGRLSQTWYYDDEVLPSLNDYDIARTGMTYLYHAGAVLHEFGYGLSYTYFRYSELEAEFYGKSIISRGSGARVAFTLTNYGPRAGDEVAQLYAVFVKPEFGMGRPKFFNPLKRLVGFERVSLAPGESRRISFDVPREDLAFWDPGAQTALSNSGLYSFEVGASSADIRLKATLWTD